MTQDTAIEKPTGTITVTRPLYTSSGAQSTEIEVTEVDVPLFEGPVAYVRVGSSITKNMGNFNSLKVDVSVELPAYALEEEVLRAADAASQLVHTVLYAEVDNALDRDVDIDRNVLPMSKQRSSM